MKSMNGGMADTNVEIPVKAGKVQVSLRGGSRLVSFRPIFSRDSKWLFVCCGELVKVFSTVTGKYVNVLSKHNKKVTSVRLNPLSHLQLYTAGLDRKIIRWDYMDAVALTVFEMHSPILAIYPVGKITLDDGNRAACALAITSGKSSEKKGLECKLRRVFLPYQSHRQLLTDVLMESVSDCENATAVGRNSEYVVSIDQYYGRSLQIYNLTKKKMIAHWLDREHKNTKMICVACHPVDACFATGCMDGVIMLWWNFYNEKHVVRSVMHWHSLPIGDLQYSAEGAYLLSGGLECVLVKWQHNVSDKDRNYKPRLGAPICLLSTSPDNLLYATCHTDNVINIITNTLDIQQVIQGLKLGHLTSHQYLDPLPVGLLIDPRTKGLVTNGSPGHLQFYNLHEDQQIFNLDIVLQNYVSPESVDKPLAVTEVESAAFNSTGTWLATVERWDDGEFSMELRLKFWKFNEVSQEFELNTNIDLPHSDRIHALKFRPPMDESDESQMVITTGYDNKFKLWTLIDDSDIYRLYKCWNCHSVGVYRDMAVRGADFCEDGSLVAVAFESVLTIWDPDSNELHATFDFRDGIKIVQFGCLSCSHLLVISTSSNIYVWNLTSCSILWKVPVDAVCLVADPLSEYMAIFTSKQHLFVFKPSDAKPVYSSKRITTDPILCAIFVPRQRPVPVDSVSPWQQKSLLYFMTKSQDFNLVADEKDLDHKLPQASSSLSFIDSQSNLPQTPFTQQIAKTKISEVPEISHVPLVGKIGGANNAILNDMLHTPAHVLPNVSTLCTSLLSSLLLTKAENISRKQSVDDDDDSDDESDKDDDSTSDMEVEDTAVTTLNSQETVKTNLSASDKTAINLPERKSFQWLQKLLNKT